MTRMSYTGLDGRTRTVKLNRWRRSVLLGLLLAEGGLGEVQLGELSQSWPWKTNSFLDWLETAGWAVQFRRGAAGSRFWALTPEGRVHAARVLRLLP